MEQAGEEKTKDKNLSLLSFKSCDIEMVLISVEICRLWLPDGPLGI
jgi:hypothetical protein